MVKIKLKIPCWDIAAKQADVSFSSRDDTGIVDIHFDGSPAYRVLLHELASVVNALIAAKSGDLTEVEVEKEER